MRFVMTTATARVILLPALCCALLSGGCSGEQSDAGTAPPGPASSTGEVTIGIPSSFPSADAPVVIAPKEVIW